MARKKLPPAFPRDWIARRRRGRKPSWCPVSVWGHATRPGYITGSCVVLLRVRKPNPARVCPCSVHPPITRWCSEFGGYHYSDTSIRTFSHTHMVGSGASDFGNLGITLTRWWNASVYTDSAKDANYRSRFSKSTEASLPGYYTAYLEDAETLAEVVATSTHSGIHRYGGGRGCPRQRRLRGPPDCPTPPRRAQLHVPPAWRARR